MLVKVYTDGACSGNPGPGGWSAVFYGESRIVKRGWCKNTTNNRMELQAIVSAYDKIVYDNMDAEESDKYIIYADSAYVVNSINNKYLDNWKVNGWKTTKGDDIKNKDLWCRLLELFMLVKKYRINVTIEKVKGHAGNTFNEDADYNARVMSEYAKKEGTAYEGLE